MLIKRLFTLCTLLLPIICNGQNVDIKLSCQLSTNYRFETNGRGIENDKETINVIFDVYQASSILSISTDSPRISSVTTLKRENIISINNTSDSNKWSLNNITKVKDMIGNTTITIDRNTGNILYVQKVTYADGRIDAEGQGNCKKIDTTKRMF